MTKVIFKIANPEEVARFIFYLKDSLREGALKDRANKPCIFVKFPDYLKKRLISSKKLSKKLKEEIEEIIIKDFSKKDKVKMRIFCKKVERYWNKNIAPIYFNEIEKLIGKKFSKFYFCYIVKELVGAYFDKNKITLTYKEERKIKEATYAVAEEILHLLYWKVWGDIFRKNFNEKVYEGKIWSARHISETIPEYLLVENNLFNKFNWNLIKREKCYWWIPKIRKILDPLWENRRDFKSFLIEAHKACKCLPK